MSDRKVRTTCHRCDLHHEVFLIQTENKRLTVCPHCSHRFKPKG